jgi:hypothetical protein
MKLLSCGFYALPIAYLSRCSSVPAQTNLPHLMGSTQPSTVHSSVKPSLSNLVPWTAYFSTQDSPVDWASAVRGIGRGQTGLPNAKVAPYIQALSTAPLLNKKILLPVGGLDAGRGQAQVKAFMNQVTRDRAKTWKKIVYDQTIALTKIPAGSSRIAWQIGNEINSKKMAENIHDWAKDVKENQSPNDEFIIPYYVEYYLAPTVEAIRKASQDSLGSDNRIPIVLGSIANAQNPNSRLWLNKLLEYRVKGTYAKSLANQSVAQLVNIIAVHYLVSSVDENWQPALDDLWKRWVGKGRVVGLWSTEELGKKKAMNGEGASTTLKVAARYLHWWGTRGIKPEAGRVSFWGWRLDSNPGTSGNDGMQALYKFLGNSPVQEIDKGLEAVSNGQMETYLFQAVNQAQKRIAVVWPHVDPDRKQFQEQPSEVTRPKTFLMPVQGWQGTIKATLQVFSPQGILTVPTTVTSTANTYTISPSQNIELPRQATALIFLEKQ